MQIGFEFQVVGIISVIIGVLLIIIGVIYLFSSSSPQHTSQKESKGIILLGPIPIIWGFGRRGKIIAIILFLFLITFWIILFFL